MQIQGRLDGYLPASAFNRTQRVVVSDGGYHFKTREETLIGPFHTEAEARFELNLFVEIKQIEREFAAPDSSHVA